MRRKNVNVYSLIKIKKSTSIKRIECRPLISKNYFPAVGGTEGT